MSRFAILLVLAGLGPTALAGTRVTVEQVEQLLSASRDQPDAKVAAKIADLELTQRASSLRLSRWQNKFHGKRIREALLVLADASCFLDLPTADIPAIEKPDPEARKQIFLRAIDYTNTTLHKLPNFFATRNTTHFVDEVSPAQKMINDHISGTPMYAGEKSSIIVTFRGGHEVINVPRKKYRNSEAQVAGLTTSGEFGPILSVVVGDVIHGKLYWAHWEQGATGPLAVFRYQIPMDNSHYKVVGFGDYPQLPAYHGEIAVDPTNGTILRVTVVAELKPPWQGFESAIAVEYGSVTIGNGVYTCPIRGIALSRVPISNAEEVAGTSIVFPAQTFVNDISFAEYHLFRADVRILP